MRMPISLISLRQGAKETKARAKTKARTKTKTRARLVNASAPRTFTVGNRAFFRKPWSMVVCG